MLREALEGLVEIIDKAGLVNLRNGVQLGATSWYVKAHDRLEYARAALEEPVEADNGLSVHVGEDGTWLNFRASDGKHACLNVETMAESYSGLVCRALKQWCKDQGSGPVGGDSTATVAARGADETVAAPAPTEAKCPNPDCRDNAPSDELDRATVTAADFNGTSWDGAPFEPRRSWVFAAMRHGYITPKPDDRDYCPWLVKTVDGEVLAEPGDVVVMLDDGQFRVIKDEAPSGAEGEAEFRAGHSSAVSGAKGVGRLAQTVLDAEVRKRKETGALELSAAGLLAQHVLSDKGPTYVGHVEAVGVEKYYVIWKVIGTGEYEVHGLPGEYICTCDDEHRAQQICDALNGQSSLQAREVWRPINEAKRDGSFELIWKRGPFVAAWISEGEHGPGWCTPDGCEVFEPTHVASLPAPPPEQKE